jgi:hypothetical protein
VAVEGGKDVAVDDLPGEGDVQLRPRLAVQLGLREVLDELLLPLERQLGERGARKPARDRPPELVVVGQHEVAVTIARPLGELLVDEVEDGDLRLAILRHHDVDERLQHAHLVAAEEGDRRHRVDAGQHDLARHLVPVAGLRENVVLGKAAASLRDDSSALARKLRRHYQRSRPTSGARSPKAPTIVKEPGARSGGPMIRL